MTTRRITITALSAALAAAGVAAPSPAVGAAPAGQSFAKQCQNQGKSRAAGAKATPYATCLTAMRRLARGQSRSPQIACATLSRKRPDGAQTSPFRNCVAAGTKLIKGGNGVDRAYLEQMIPHHVGAVEMAEIALAQTQTPFLRELAETIVRTQNAEIAQMRSMAGRLKAAGMRAVPLGLSKAQMGMDHEMSHLVAASPFDTVFVDMMIPHHQGAVTMSAVVFAKGTSAAIRQLAARITDSQRREIRNMRAFRESVTGAPGPAAGGEGTPLHTHPGDPDPHPH
jgi:uncharacterized protein (DUF305 family)